MTRHVIVGGGPAATNAVQTIRQYDAQSEIVLLSDEPAHSRMALPYWIANQISQDRILTANDTMWRELKVDAQIGARVRAIHPTKMSVETEDGKQHSYDRLLIATGSRPNSLSIPGIDGKNVQPCWSIRHVESLLDSLRDKPQPRVVMIGAGFIGFIVLNAMYKRGWSLTVIEREKHVLPRMLNAASASMVKQWLTQRNVAVHCGVSVQSIADTSDGSKLVSMSSGEKITADLVIVAIGVRPNIELAVPAGIATQEGILVDSRMQTSIPNVYAAGDVTQGPVLHSDLRQVHAIQPTAVDQGRIAGANMAGQAVSYPGSLLMNVLDVCGLQCVSYGSWDEAQSTSLESRNEMPPNYRNVVLDADRIVGAIFVGQANDVGMLTDAGMIKGFLQTGTSLGPWLDYLRANPFDLRRPYIATGVPEKLRKLTLLGAPSQTPAYRQSNPQDVQRGRPHLATYQAMQQQ
ncbi:MAG: FAD-dependent oxidoreductase [Planctomycetota bacterium]|nr:FAD-dependent oxidoreductase [Planctomycetota bacterium]MDA1177367.1 FAD-dependent oxidoreductase [Planctomycetota bacterium]